MDKIVPRGQLRTAGQAVGGEAHVWPYADADAGPIPAAACSHHQPVYPVAGSSSSHLLLQHPNVILDASHEPRLAIIGSTVSPPHDECEI